MRKAKDIIGLPVLTFDTGHRLHKVHDLLFDPNTNRVLALLIDSGGWFDAAKVIPFERIKSIGDDAVVVPDDGALVEAQSNEAILAALKTEKVVTNLRVFTDDGRELGTIGDMWVDEASGEVMGYEVTGGLVNDTLKGKRFMPAPATMTIGRDVSFVPSDVGNQMDAQVTGGVQKTLGNVGEKGQDLASTAGEKIGQVADATMEKAGTLADTTKEKAGTLADATKEKAGTLADSTKERVGTMSASQQRNYVIGKRATTTVKAPDGHTIVSEGAEITPLAADEAERYGMMGQLAMDVGGSQMQGVGSSMQEVGGQMGEGVGQLFEAVKSTVGQVTQNLQTEAEQRRINAAVGRPVTRVILDKGDGVILNTGELITNESVNRAREAGVLDMLLSSASTDQPKFGTETRTAPEPGAASLEQERSMSRPGMTTPGALGQSPMGGPAKPIIPEQGLGPASGVGPTVTDEGAEV